MQLEEEILEFSQTQVTQPLASPTHRASALVSPARGISQTAFDTDGTPQHYDCSQNYN